MLRGAVSGFGGVGKKFTRYVNRGEHARIVAAYDIAPTALASARDEYGLATADSPDALCAMDIDFVIVSSVNAAHCEQVLAAAAAGVHVFCEKPIALTRADADAMVAAAEKAGIISAVNYGYRASLAHRWLKDAITAGRLGDLLALQYCSGRGYGLQAAGARHPAVERPDLSGGWTVHHMCHGIDMAIWLAESPVQRIYGVHRSTVLGEGKEEIVFGVATLGNGVTVQLSEWTGRLREKYYTAVGSAGTAILHGEREKSVIRFHREGAEAEENTTQVPIGKRKGGNIDYFLDCVRKGEPTSIDLAAGRNSLLAALALQESARTGMVIEVSPTEPQPMGTTSPKSVV